MPHIGCSARLFWENRRTREAWVDAGHIFRVRKLSEWRGGQDWERSKGLVGCVFARFRRESSRGLAQRFWLHFDLVNRFGALRKFHAYWILERCLLIQSLEAER